MPRYIRRVRAGDTDSPGQKLVRLAPTRIQLELRIEEHRTRKRDAYVKIGLSLGLIRDEKLYKPEYPTFAEYGRRRWDWAESTLYGYIKAA